MAEFFFFSAMGKDEMCNFYMMVYWKSTDEYPFDDGPYPLLLPYLILR